MISASFSGGVMRISLEISAVRMATLMECLYTKSAELRSICAKFSL